MARQPIIAFTSNLQDYNFVGGLAYPLNLLIQSGFTPEEITQDRAALNLLAFCLKESGKCFKAISDDVYTNLGLNKSAIVTDYETNYQKLNETRELTDGTFKAPEEFNSRISWDRA